jgi:hypothetical protein
MSHIDEHVIIKARTSGLAIASLVLACLGAVAGPFGFLPGIVCGHLALRSIRRNRDQNGEGIARAGLIVGYVFMAITLVCVILLLSGHIKPGSSLQDIVSRSGVQTK